MIESLKNFFWPATCVPTKIYVAILLINLFFIVCIVAFIMKNAKASEGNENVSRTASNKVMIVSLLAFLICIVVTVALFNFMCGSGSQNSQIMSGILGFFFVSPMVPFFVFYPILFMFLTKEEMDLLFVKKDGEQMQ